jgi:hypothetical protein
VGLFAGFDLSEIRGLVPLLFLAVIISCGATLPKKISEGHNFSALKTMMSSQLGNETSVGSIMG